MALNAKTDPNYVPKRQQCNGQRHYQGNSRFRR